MGRRVCGVKESVKEGEGQKEEDFEEIRAEVNEGGGHFPFLDKTPKYGLQKTLKYPNFQVL